MTRDRMKARELYESLFGAVPPLVLDVRNDDEFARWPIEGPGTVDTLHLPYFEFIENEAGSIDRVRKWIGERSRDLAVVCAKGGSSEYVADLLRGQGVGAANVEGGMIAWGSQTVAKPFPTTPPLQAWQIHRFGKGCLSYVVAAESDAAVVDPHRRHSEYLEFLREHGLQLRGVFDTHLHADHVSGGPAIARETGVPYYGGTPDFEGAQFPYHPLDKLQRITLGKIEIVPIEVIPTPGHTPGSTCLLVNDQLLLTGDTVFVESIGRPDLGGKTAEWARDLYVSLTSRLASLSDDLFIFPAHTSGPKEMKPGGLVYERWGALRKQNPALRLDEKEFVQKINESVAPAPPHYARIRRINLGLESPSEEELEEIELGKNECALSRR